jgi:hypothetical protein
MPDPLMGLRPSELCSSHAAVRHLRRRSPLDVARAREPPRLVAARRRSAVRRTKPRFAQTAETAAASRNHRTANGNTEMNPSDRKASPIRNGPPKQTALEMDPPTGSADRGRRRTVQHPSRAAGRSRRSSCDTADAPAEADVPAASEKAPGASSPSGVCSTRESATRRRRFRPTCCA